MFYYFAAFALAVWHGRRWSSKQRFKSVQEAYNQDLDAVRSERSGDTEETMTVVSFWP